MKRWAVEYLENGAWKRFAFDDKPVWFVSEKDAEGFINRWYPWRNYDDVRIVEEAV